MTTVPGHQQTSRKLRFHVPCSAEERRALLAYSCRIGGWRFWDGLYGTVHGYRYMEVGTGQVHAQKAFQTVSERKVNLGYYSGSLPESLYLAKTSYSTLQ